jgi:hypothetical protein
MLDINFLLSRPLEMRPLLARFSAGILPAGVEIVAANTQCRTLLLVGGFLYLCRKISGEMALR